MPNGQNNNEMLTMNKVVNYWIAQCVIIKMMVCGVICGGFYVVKKEVKI